MQVVAYFTVLQEINNQDEFDLWFDPPSADIKASLAGYLVRLPISFQDFSQVLAYRHVYTWALGTHVCI
jgi:hypothetical protein